MATALKKMGSPLPEPWTVTAPWWGPGICRTLPTLCWSAAWLLSSLSAVLLQSCLTSGFDNLSAHSSLVIPEPGGWHRCPIWGTLLLCTLTGYESLHLTTGHHTEKLLWWELRALLIHSKLFLLVRFCVWCVHGSIYVPSTHVQGRGQCCWVGPLLLLSWASWDLNPRCQICTSTLPSGPSHRPWNFIIWLTILDQDCLALIDQAVVW